MIIRLALLFVILTKLDRTQGFINTGKDESSLLYGPTKRGLLIMHEITERSFNISWKSEDFANSHNYTVKLKDIDGCDATEYEVFCPSVSCSFDLSTYCTDIVPCTDISVMVTSSKTDSEELQFNTAPRVTELQDMTFGIDGTTATVIWNSEDLKSNDTSCATRAEVRITHDGVGIYKEVITELIPTNTIITDLDPCDIGKFGAEITYVTGDDDYDTTAKYSINSIRYSGVGIKEPPETVPGDTIGSIEVSWNSVCTDVDKYHLTWNDNEIDLDDTTITTYTIRDLEPGNYTVCVSAYIHGDLIGEQFCSDTQVKQGLLVMNEITESSFSISWLSELFANSRNYTVKLNEIVGCDVKEYDTFCPFDTCSFNLSEHCNDIQPCTSITVMVTSSETESEELQFNTAPRVTELQDMIFEINGTNATVIWNSEDFETDNTRCATRAKVRITPDDTEIYWNVVTELNLTNSISKELDPCVADTVGVEITYVTGFDDYDTTATHTVESIEYSGVGINEPPETVPGDASCSIEVSWNSVCSDVNEYHLTWADKEIVLNITTHTIDDLKPGNYNVCVSAYKYNDTIGEQFCSETQVKQVLPGATKIDTLEPNDDSNDKMTVEWTGPDTNICPRVGGFNITWSKVGEGSIIGRDTTSVEKTSYTITGLTACILYEVEVNAYSGAGNGTAGSKKNSIGAEGTPGVTRIEQLGLESDSNKELTVQWTGPETSECASVDGFYITWRKSGESIIGSQSAPSKDTSYTITGLRPCTKYEVEVEAFSKTGNGTTESKSASTTAEEPPVEDLNIANIESINAHITWKRPSSPCPLKYVVNHNGTTLWTNNQTTDSGSTQIVSDPDDSADLNNLYPFAHYTVCVNATCTKFTTDGEVPSVPRDVTFENSSITSESLTLMWVFPEAENGILESYDVTWSMEGGKSYNSTVNDSVTFYKITDLCEGIYNFSVSAVNSDGSSNPSEPVEQSMDGPFEQGSGSGCGGGCIAGIVVAVLLVALAVPVFIFRDRIKSQIKSKKLQKPNMNFQWASRLDPRKLQKPNININFLGGLKHSKSSSSKNGGNVNKNYDASINHSSDRNSNNNVQNSSYVNEGQITGDQTDHAYNRQYPSSLEDSYNPDHTFTSASSTIGKGPEEFKVLPTVFEKSKDMKTRLKEDKVEFKFDM